MSWDERDNEARFVIWTVGGLLAVVSGAAWYLISQIFGGC